MVLFTSPLTSSRLAALFQTDSHLAARPPRPKRAYALNGSLISPVVKLQAGQGHRHRHQGLRNEAGHMSPKLHAVVPAMLIRVDRLRPPPGGIASSTRNRESAPGSPKTHVGPTPTQTPPSHGWCRPLRIQELAPKWEPRLFPFPTPGAGLAFRVKGWGSVRDGHPALLACLAPRPTYNASARHVLRPGRHSLPFPSRSGPISSRHSFSGSELLLPVCLLVCLSYTTRDPGSPEHYGTAAT